ncbi:hypothetical protein [Paenibacillus sp. PCH8]|nr:hypothetical protein [Paenibacillus sp. PCH8]
MGPMIDLGYVRHGGQVHDGLVMAWAYAPVKIQGWFQAIPGIT